MKAHPQQVRQEALSGYRSGKTLKSISEELGVSYRTVRTWMKKYRETGEKGLVPDYSSCGKKSTFSQEVIDYAVALKREHPLWGAGFIRLKLEDEYPGKPLPKERQIQNYFLRYGVSVPKKDKLPAGSGDWAKAPFDRVQVDAKECLTTGDGKPCCYLNFTDEYTGADLDAFVFPLREDIPSAGQGDT